MSCFSILHFAFCLQAGFFRRPAEIIRRLAGAGCAALLLGGAVAGQSQLSPSPTQAAPQPPVTFKVEINYVEVDAVVSDPQGSFIRGLKKEDFQVFEDGKLQTIAAFAPVDIPVERVERPLFAPQAIEPDVRTNERGFEGRLYVLVLDDLHTHPLRSNRVQAAARQFITRNLGANDLAAVVHTSGRTDASQEFTNNPRLLLAAVNKFLGRKLRSSTLERLEEYQRQRDRRQPGERIDDPLDFERGHQARTALQTLRGIAEVMTGIRGRRKSLVFISEGIDYDIHDVFNASYASTVLDEARSVIAAATRANVGIYSVDPRGLTQLGDEAIEIQSLPDDTSLNLGMGSLHDELRLAQDSLRVLSDETGGFAALNSNDFAQAFSRIVRENSSYYLLGYYPTNDRRDGRFRKIQVRVNRSGAQVRARKGYAAPRGKAPAPVETDTRAGTSAELREALSNPLPLSGLTLAAFAAPFKGTAPNASVAVAVRADGSDLTFTERDGKFTDDLEVSIVAVDSQGKIRGGDRQSVNMTLKPDTHSRVVRTGFQTLSRIDLPPGRYQLRIAARESGRGAVGSVQYDLEVPDFFKAPFAMSGLVITSSAASLVPTGRPDDQLKEMLPGPPATEREFASTDEIVLAVEVYDNQASTPHKVDIIATVRTDEGKVVFKNEEERSTAELQGARGGFGYTAKIPLRDLAPGLYVLTVEARSRLGQGATATREVQFRVRGNPPSQDRADRRLTR